MKRRARSTRRKGGHSPGAGATPALRYSSWLLALVLVAVTFIAYQPAWHGQPLWDDAAHMTRGGLRSLEGLARIWLEPGATQQYYPLTHTVFWIQHRLWGAETFGHHLLNIALHLLTALLFARALQTLEIRGACLAAAVFALHPVHVESVAWITELKNTLSGALFVGAILAYLRFDTVRRRATYVLERRGRVDEAIAYYRRALEVWADYPDAHVNLGNALFVQGKLEDAIGHYEKALRLRPELVEPHNNLAFALLAQGKPKEAVPHFEAVLRLDGSSRTTLVGLARTLAVSTDPGIRDGARAVELAERAARLSHRTDPVILEVLAAAYAEAGRFGDAVATTQAVLDQARAANRDDLADRLEARLRLYRSGLPFREESP